MCIVAPTDKHVAVIMFSFLIVGVGTLFAQSTAPLEKRPFVRVSLHDGLPESTPIHNFGPIRRNLIRDVKHAQILLADTLGSVFVCCGRDTANVWHFFGASRHVDSTWTLYRLDFNQNVQDTLRTSADLRLIKNKPSTFPIDMRMHLPSNSIRYRWILSPDHPNIPGGIPVATNLKLDEGKPIFPVLVRTLDETSIDLSSLKGKVCVVNWWATWCHACVEEIPGFNNLVNKYGSRVHFLAVAISSPRLKDFLLLHPFLFDQTYADESMFEFIGAGIPKTAVIDQRGIITFLKIGGSDDAWKEIDNAIVPLLAK